MGRLVKSVLRGGPALTVVHSESMSLTDAIASVETLLLTTVMSSASLPSGQGLQL